MSAKKWKFIAKFQSSSGVSDEFCHIFMAKELTKTDQNKQTEEGIRLKKLSTKKIISMIREGKITDAHIIAGISLALLKKEIK